MPGMSEYVLPALPLSPLQCLQLAIEPALALLPAVMDSLRARVQLLAMAGQESGLKYRRQIRGPARGLWQFERGTQRTRGGVWGVYLHPASRDALAALCALRGVAFEPAAIYSRLEHDDVLAAGCARLLLWTASAPLPEETDADAGWQYYLGLWRPGKPHPETWAAHHAAALGACGVHPFERQS
jgi:hypothetical protein